VLKELGHSEEVVKMVSQLSVRISNNLNIH